MLVLKWAPPTVGEAVLALMKALKGSTEDLEPAINQGGHRCIEELVAECCHDAGALLELRNELDEATVDGFLEELKEYKRKAIIIAKKYYDEGIEMVEALLGAWGSPGPQSPSKNSKTPSGEASKAPLGGPPPQGRGKGRGGSSSFLPSPSSNHPRAQSSPGVTAWGLDSDDSEGPQPNSGTWARSATNESAVENSLEPSAQGEATPTLDGGVNLAVLNESAIAPRGPAPDRAGLTRSQRRWERRCQDKKDVPGLQVLIEEAAVPRKIFGTPRGEASKVPLGGPPPQGRGNGWRGSSSFLPSPFPDHPRVQSSPGVADQGSDSGAPEGPKANSGTRARSVMNESDGENSIEPSAQGEATPTLANDVNLTAWNEGATAPQGQALDRAGLTQSQHCWERRRRDKEGMLGPQTLNQETTRLGTSREVGNGSCNQRALQGCGCASLVQLGSPEDLEVLMPAHFLLASNPFLGLGPFLEENAGWRKRNRLGSVLWERLHKEYLQAQARFSNERGALTTRFQPGDLVMVLNIKTPVGLWAVGCILEIKEGSDRRKKKFRLRVGKKIDVVGSVAALAQLKVDSTLPNERLLHGPPSLRRLHICNQRERQLQKKKRKGP